MGRAKGCENAVHIGPGQNSVYISDDEPYAYYKKYDGQYKGHRSQKGKEDAQPADHHGQDDDHLQYPKGRDQKEGQGGACRKQRLRAGQDESDKIQY